MPSDSPLRKTSRAGNFNSHGHKTLLKSETDTSAYLYSLGRSGIGLTEQYMRKLPVLMEANPGFTIDSRHSA